MTSLYEINTRVRMFEIGARATLDDIADADLDAFRADGVDIVWFLGVWQTGEAGRRIALHSLDEYRRVLPDVTPDDVAGSPFAICDYKVHTNFGGNAALARLRERMNRRGLRLMLDFVPNHVATDHPWVVRHPEWFVAGTEEQLAQEPQNYMRVAGGRILAHGRDPYFPGWSDTLQLNYGHPALQDAMIGELKAIAAQCDGVRCDMAMLVLPDVVQRTWGIAMRPFWPRAIEAVRKVNRDFLLLAEAYWDLEGTMVQQGFDFAYDKRLYDLLEHDSARDVRAHLSTGVDLQNHLARFLENHDEPRAASTFPLDRHRAAAVITYLAPGLRFFQQGQREGKKVRIPVQLRRGPKEPVDRDIAKFYDALLACLRDDRFRGGQWQLAACRAAWGGNPTFDDFTAFTWPDALVAVNDSSHQSQCYVRLPWSGAKRYRDLLSDAVYDREGSELYLDMPPWGVHVFDVSAAGS